jgi:hypothetical protein
MISVDVTVNEFSARKAVPWDSRGLITVIENYRHKQFVGNRLRTAKFKNNKVGK